MQWDPKRLGTGIASVDSEHEKLFEIINRLQVSVSEGGDGNSALQVIQELVAYTDYHFGLEESMLELFQYPDIERHRELHAAFVVKIRKFQKDVEQGNSEVGTEVLNFLRSWLFQHIELEDLRYASFIRKNNMSI